MRSYISLHALNIGTEQDGKACDPPKTKQIIAMHAGHARDFQ